MKKKSLFSKLKKYEILKQSEIEQKKFKKTKLLKNSKFLFENNYLGEVKTTLFSQANLRFSLKNNFFPKLQSFAIRFAVGRLFELNQSENHI